MLCKGCLALFLPLYWPDFSCPLESIRHHPRKGCRCLQPGSYTICYRSAGVHWYGWNHRRKRWICAGWPGARGLRPEDQFQVIRRNTFINLRSPFSTRHYRIKTWKLQQKAFRKSLFKPVHLIKRKKALSLRTIGTEEIKRSPGKPYISRVIQSLPGGLPPYPFAMTSLSEGAQTRIVLPGWCRGAQYQPFVTQGHQVGLLVL